jgi:hypothetical protein
MKNKLLLISQKDSFFFESVKQERKHVKTNLKLVKSKKRSDENAPGKKCKCG